MLGINKNKEKLILKSRIIWVAIGMVFLASYAFCQENLEEDFFQLTHQSSYESLFANLPLFSKGTDGKFHSESRQLGGIVFSDSKIGIDFGSTGAGGSLGGFYRFSLNHNVYLYVYSVWSGLLSGRMDHQSVFRVFRKEDEKFIDVSRTTLPRLDFNHVLLLYDEDNKNFSGQTDLNEVPKLFSLELDRKKGVFFVSHSSYPFSCVVSSSTRAYEKDVSNPFQKYSSVNLMNKDVNSSWVAGRSNNGVGEYVLFTNTNRREVTIESIGIVNGYGSNKKLYYENNRIRSLKMIVHTSLGYFEHNFDLKDQREEQWLELPYNFGTPHPAFSVDSLVLVITDYYPGSKYSDTCLSKVEFKRPDISIYETQLAPIDKLMKRSAASIDFSAISKNMGASENGIFHAENVDCLRIKN